MPTHELVVVVAAAAMGGSNAISYHVLLSVYAILPITNISTGLLFVCLPLAPQQFVWVGGCTHLPRAGQVRGASGCINRLEAGCPPDGQNLRKKLSASLPPPQPPQLLRQSQERELSISLYVQLWLQIQPPSTLRVEWEWRNKAG